VDPKLLTAEVERKIIYTAHIHVVVKDVEAAMAEVKQLIQSHKGYIAKSEVRGQVGQRRTAEYVLRVPVSNFNALQEALLQLGFAERNALESQDVTE
jgi:(p)ppGpp synthase/HD superfamily hydrolase